MTLVSEVIYLEVVLEQAYPWETYPPTSQDDPVQYLKMKKELNQNGKIVLEHANI